jgi:actin-related protein
MSKSARESQLRQKSREVMGYSGDLKYISERRRDEQLKDASREIYNFTGDFKIQRRLFEKIHYARLSAQHKKFDGMDEENRLEHWWASLWKRSMDQKKKPEPLRKPRYDSKEHEIWFY